MTTVEFEDSSERTLSFAGVMEAVAFWLLVGTLAWAPFPLGSNRPWSWSLLIVFIAAVWVAWVLAIWTAPEKLRVLKRVKAPLILAGLALCWALIQTASWVPQSWIHPVWQLGGDLLGRMVKGAISIDPWRTITETMKLTAYLMAAVLAYMMSQKHERASRLLDALMIVAAFYALYGAGLQISGLQQENIFYSTRAIGDGAGGPFVSHNNFSTYMGLGALMAGVRLFDLGGRTLVVGRGLREFTVSAIYFVFGVGALPASAFVLTFGMMVASGSRAGFMAALVGIATLMAFGSVIAGQRLSRRWAIIGLASVCAVMLVLFMITGDTLTARFDALVETGKFDQMRLMLWQSAMRMIADSPLLGLGLGTFEPAYPLYADRVLPFVMDKVHNDYLEFAAGLGLPAAILWWAAVLWLAGMCVRGIYVRRRHRHYSLLAIAATALVGFHSIFDFSLQIPAIALTYAVILGLGVAQAAPTRNVAFD
jgi:O-antigen ligase